MGELIEGKMATILKAVYLRYAYYVLIVQQNQFSLAYRSGRAQEAEAVDARIQSIQSLVLYVLFQRQLIAQISRST